MHGWLFRVCARWNYSSRTKKQKKINHCHKQATLPILGLPFHTFFFFFFLQRGLYTVSCQLKVRNPTTGFHRQQFRVLTSLLVAKKSLAEQLADLDTTAPAGTFTAHVQHSLMPHSHPFPPRMVIDLDPEQFDDTFQERGAEDEEGPVSDDDKNARDHYVDVGKSALRKSQFLLEDPKYGGKRSNRKSIFDDAGSEEISDAEEEGDAEDDEDDEDENVADSDDGDIELAEQSDDEELESDEMNDDDEAEEDDESDQDEEAPPIENEAEVQEELKRLREEEKKMLSTMTKSAQADIEKGQHVKEQLTLWDGFLDTRIRMQKAMNIANQLPQVTPTARHLPSLYVI